MDIWVMILMFLTVFGIGGIYQELVKMNKNKADEMEELKEIREELKKSKEQ
ncbi:hypothetical protein [Halalkalibacillus sediminis]|uniref:hypothetical protein n=1 Tax=Halalkalibacillus sediminis TaxID=2018042 RepID=UPI00139030ED|nr:hypothetical protein [Halalkalibacillus sediminis]